MVYQVNGPQQSNDVVLTLSERCSEMIYKARCVPEVNNQYVKPILEYFATKDPPITHQEDPLNIAWSILRQGGMLCTLVNVYRPSTIDTINYLEQDDDGKYVIEEEVFMNEEAQENLATFLHACEVDLYFKPEELFEASSLYEDNTNSLKKTLAIAEKFFDKIAKTRRTPFAKMIAKMKEEEAAAEMAARRLSTGSEGSAGSSNDKRLKVIQEILSTEYAYVKDLERLSQYKEELILDKVVSDETIEAMFSNLDDLIDFQRRYSILVAATLKPVLRDVEASYAAHLGKKLFIDMEEGFSVYNTYVSNNAKARDAVLDNMEALMSKAKLMDPQGTVNSFLIKPIQRICKYPLLIRELIKNSAETAPDREELQEAYKVADRITTHINELMTMGENSIEAEKMQELVTDWSLNKAKIDKTALGELYRFEKASQIGKEGSTSDVTLYLFDNYLFSCRAGKASIISSRPGLSFKSGFRVRDIAYVEDISNPDDKVYAIRWCANQGGAQVFLAFKVQNAESVKLWVKAAGKVGIEKSSGKEEFHVVPEAAGNKRSSFMVKRKAPGAAMGVPAVAAAAGVGAAAGAYAAPVAATQPKPQRITLQAIQEDAGSEPLQLKIIYQGECYLRIIPQVPSIEQIKKFALKTISADFERFDLPFNLAKENICLKYLDNEKDLINVMDENDIRLAHLVNPNRLTIHVFDSRRIEKGAQV